ncbi:MAG TPA: carboxymuconolactone decarboxylase family protein [Steroidobacteraceae bacterium]|nr:carboxymuconolactone decarboxylase family protein [Steroidobacteraceae bacterium]
MPDEARKPGSSPVTEEEIQAREAHITGKPPRISPLAPGEFGPEATETVAALRGALSAGPSSGEVPEIIATLLRHPALFRPHLNLAMQLFTGALLPRDREIAILRTVWLCMAPYEWGEHVAAGKRVAGLTTEEIERITMGSAAPGWNEQDRSLIRAVEELHDTAMISDQTWAALARRFDERQLIELPILVGQYQGVSYLENALRLRLIPGNPGLSAR